MGDVSDFQRGQIVGVFSWGICNETVTLLGVSKAAISKVMVTYTNHGRTSSAKRNGGQKPNQVKGIAVH